MRENSEAEKPIRCRVDGVCDDDPRCGDCKPARMNRGSCLKCELNWATPWNVGLNSCPSCDFAATARQLHEVQKALERRPLAPETTQRWLYAHKIVDLLSALDAERLKVAALQKELDTRGDATGNGNDSRTAAGKEPESTAVPATDRGPLTSAAVVERTVAVMRLLDELKEDILWHHYGVQPQFDAGMLEAANAILRANVDDEDPLVVAEGERQMNARLLRALANAPRYDEIAKAREAQASPSGSFSNDVENKDNERNDLPR